MGDYTGHNVGFAEGRLAGMKDALEILSRVAGTIIVQNHRQTRWALDEVVALLREKHDALVADKPADGEGVDDD